VITPEVFDEAQAVLRRKPRARNPKQRHAFMGLLTCAKCGCAITAERKKGKYVYYHCTDHHGDCDNTYIREERLGELLGQVITPIQIPPEVAAHIAEGIQSSDCDAERQRTQAVEHLEQRRRAVLAKLDRGGVIGLHRVRYRPHQDSRH
jgi:site-specific DNA recombinase